MSGGMPVAPGGGADRAVWVLRLRPLPRVDGERAVQGLLKFALRQCGLKCVGLAKEETVVERREETA